jgi:hydrogenase/urease accessory protein HupE
MIEVEPGIYEVTWKVPLRYGVRLPVDPVFPSNCSTISERTVETFPSALVERWRIECGPKGLDGRTIEISGLAVTLIDAFVRLEMVDGRIYNRLLRGASPRFTVEPRISFFRIAQSNFIFGLRNAIRKVPVILLVVAAVLYFGQGWILLGAFGAFALGYTLSLFGNAFSMIATAPGWGSATAGVTALSLALRATGEYSRSRQTVTAALFLIVGILYGSTFGSEWGGEGLAYLDIPIASVTLFAGVLFCMILLSGIPILARIVARDFGSERVKYLHYVPIYLTGALGVFLVLDAARGLFPAGMVQPYLRPESMLIALAIGYMLGCLNRDKTVLCAGCLILFISVGLAFAVADMRLPFSSAAIPLTILIAGIALQLRDKVNFSAGVILCCMAGLYHGWINSSWLLEHVNVLLPSVAGGLVLLLGILVAGIVIRSCLLRETAVRWGRILGIAIIGLSFWMRISGYRVSQFREMSVSAAGGIEIPVLAIVVLAAALTLLVRTKSRISRPGAALLAISLVLVPVGGLTLGGGASSLAEMSDEDATVLIAGLLENTYRAVNLRGEEEIYDRLATSVDGDLVEVIYLESRRRSVMPGQAETEAKLIGVQVMGISDRSPVPDGSGYSFTATWMVTGTVRHWAHKHNRLNRYNGVITIRAVGDIWKISGLELLDEIRL